MAEHYKNKSNKFHFESELGNEIYGLISEATKKGKYSIKKTYREEEVSCEQLKDFSFYMRTNNFKAAILCFDHLRKNDIYINWESEVNVKKASRKL